MIIQSMNEYVRNMIMRVTKVLIFQKCLKVVEFYNNARVKTIRTALQLYVTFAIGVVFALQLAVCGSLKKLVSVRLQ